MLAAVLLSIALLPPPPPSTGIDPRLCDIGRAAFHDLPSINGLLSWPERYYNGRTDQYHIDILDLCPALVKYLPLNTPLANDAVFERFKTLSTLLPIVIADVEVPVIDASGLRASVKMGYYCNGLCGARFIATYVRKRKGWVIEGRPNIVSVS